MPRATEPRPLTKTEARLLWLRAQRLDTSEPFGAGPQAVASAVDHLGYVQIDTIHVIERCHHHILYSRIPAYRPRGPAPGAEHRQERVRILDPCAVLCAGEGFSLLRPGDAGAPARGAPVVCLRQARGHPQGDAVVAARRRADHPRHRGRRSDREGTSVAKPQTLEAGAAACVLYRRGDDLRTHRHAQDL